MVPVHYLKDRTVLWGSLYLFLDNMASYLVSERSYPYGVVPNLCIDDLLYALLLPGRT